MFQVLCQRLGPMQIRRGPPPTCSPLQTATAGRLQHVVTHSASTPSSLPALQKPSVISHQSAVVHLPSRQSPPVAATLHYATTTAAITTTGRTRLAGLLGLLTLTLALELLCSDPGSCSWAPDWNLGLGPELGQTQDWRCQHQPVSVRVHSISNPISPATSASSAVARQSRPPCHHSTLTARLDLTWTRILQVSICQNLPP